MHSELNQYIQTNSLEVVVSLCGQLPRVQVQEYFSHAHLHLLTSAYEANTTVMFEAMEECIPSVVFDHFGMADLVQDGVTGRKISVSSYDVMCRTWAELLDEITENPILLKEWAENLHETSRRYTSEKRVEFFENCYKIAVGSVE